MRGATPTGWWTSFATSASPPSYPVTRTLPGTLSAETEMDRCERGRVHPRHHWRGGGLPLRRDRHAAGWGDLSSSATDASVRRRGRQGETAAHRTQPPRRRREDGPLAGMGPPESIQVRYFWRDAAPGGGGAPADPPTLATEETGLTSVSKASAAGSFVRFYRDGLLVKTKHFDAEGRLHRIDHRDPARRLLAREFFDIRGRLVFTDEMSP